MARNDDHSDGLSYAPFGLRAGEAARYLGYSVSAFHDRVKAGIFPKPVKDRGVAVWLRDELEQSLRDLRDQAHENKAEEEDAWLARIGS